MIPMADIVKLSDEDLDWLGPLMPQDLLSGRAIVIAQTHGAEGVTLHSRHGEIHVAAPKAHVIDTVGAGDTFNAAFLTALSDSLTLTPRAIGLAEAETLHRAARFATRVATFSTTRPGANPPTRSEIL